MLWYRRPTNPILMLSIILSWTRARKTQWYNSSAVSKSVFSSLIRQDMMLEGLEDDPDFWNMGPDDCDDEAPIAVKDLTLSLLFYIPTTQVSL